MSDTASSAFPPFTIIPNMVLFSGVSANAVRLYALLQHYATMPLGAVPSRATLGQQMGGVSRDTVDRALKELVIEGFVVVTNRWLHQDKTVSDIYAPGAEPTTNQYRLPLTPSRKDAATLAAPVRPPSRKDAAHNDIDLSNTELITEVSVSLKNHITSLFNDGKKDEITGIDPNLLNELWEDYQSNQVSCAPALDRV